MVVIALILSNSLSGGLGNGSLYGVQMAVGLVCDCLSALNKIDSRRYLGRLEDLFTT